MTISKKVIAILLALLMMFSSLSVVAFAAEPDVSGTLTINTRFVDNNGNEITKVTPGDTVNVRVSVGTTYYTTCGSILLYYDKDFFMDYEAEIGGVSNLTVNSKNAEIVNNGLSFEAIKYGPAANDEKGCIKVIMDTANEYVYKMNETSWLFSFKMTVKSTFDETLDKIGQIYAGDAASLTNRNGNTNFPYGVAGDYAADATPMYYWNATLAFDTTKEVTVKNTVTFDKDNGDATAPVEGVIGTVNSIPDASKEGYTLIGWNSSDENVANISKGMTSFTMPITEGVTYTAQWTKNVTIKFADSGDTPAADLVDRAGGQPWEASDIPTPEKAGYKFIGWEGTGITGTGDLPENYPEAVGETTEFTYTAKWANESTINFKINGTDFHTITGSQTVYGGATWTDTDSEAKNNRSYYTVSNYKFANAALKAWFEENCAGYIVTGWKDDDGNFIKGLPETYPDAQVTNYTAVLIPQTTNTTYYVNRALLEAGTDFTTFDYSTYGGTAVISNKEQAGTKNTVVAYNDVDENVEITQWAYKNSEGNYVIVNSGSEYTKGAALTFYAVAYKHVGEVSISFVDSDGNAIAGITPINGVAGDVVPAASKPNDPTKDGYTFIGWYPAIPDVFGEEDIVITAMWEKAEYDIEYNFDAEEITNVTLSATYGDDIVTPVEPDREGYLFKGWKYYNQKSPEGVYSDPFTGTTMPAYDFYAKAEWEALPFSITYDLNTLDADGNVLVGTPAFTGADDAKFVDDGNKKVYTDLYKETVIVPGAVLSGYKFDGWFTEGGTEFKAPATVPAENISVKAKWSLDKFTVTFMPGDKDVEGAALTGTPTITTSGDKFKDSEELEGSKVFEDKFGANVVFPTASLTGYDFQGWYKDDGVTKYQAPKTITAEHITVTAKWKEKAPDTKTVTFDGNTVDTDGNTLIGTPSISDATFSAPIGDPVTVSTATLPGYQFDDWYYENGDPIGSNFTMPSEDVTVYAHWKILSKSVRFSPNTEDIDGNTLVGIPVITTSGDKFTDDLDNDNWKMFTDKYGASVVIPTAELAGYTFKGWALENGSKYEGAKTIPSEDLTVKAQWEIKDNIKVTFDKNTKDTEGNDLIGTPAIIGLTERTGKYGATISNLPTASLDGYTFEGWYTTTETAYDGKIPAENATVYAYWTAKTFTGDSEAIVFDYNYKTTDYDYESEPESYKSKNNKFGAAVNKPADPERTGYTFGGWAEAADSTDVSDQIDKLATDLSKDSLTFYAIWNTGDDVSYELKYEITDKNGAVQTKTYNRNAKVEAEKTVTDADVIAAIYAACNETVSRADYKAAFTATGDLSFKVVPNGKYKVTVDRSQFDYTIDLDGGTLEGVTSGKTEKKYFGADIAAPGVPEKEGYTYTWQITDSKAYPFTMPSKDVTAKANWSLEEYEVNYIYFSEGAKKSETKTLKYGDNVLVNAPTIDAGYITAGWTYLTTGGTYAVVSNATTIKGEKTYYARYIAKAEYVLEGETTPYYTVRVNFDYNDIAANYVPSERFANVEYLDEATMLKDGWIGEGGKVLTNSGLAASEPKAYTFTAAIVPRTYDITFDANGGKFGKLTSVVVEDVNYGANIKGYYDDQIGTNPTRDGYTFAGWLSDLELAVCEGTETFYAVWTPNEYELSFYSDTECSELIDTLTSEYGEEIPTPLDPESETFDGWVLKDSNKPLTWYNIFSADADKDYKVNVIPKNKNLQLNITFVHNDGTTDKTTVIRNNGEEILGTDVPTVTKANHGFLGWIEESLYDEKMTEADVLQNKLKSGTKATSDVEYIAFFEPNALTVTYYFNGQKIYIDKTAKYGEDYTVKFELVGNKFAQWNTQEDKEGQIINNDNKVITSLTSSFALYADDDDVIVPEYDVVLNPVGGKFSDGSKNPKELTVKEGDAVNDGVADPTKAGYTFGGWVDGNGNPASTADRANTYYAKWLAGEYTISFEGYEDDQGGVLKLNSDYGDDISTPEEKSVSGMKFVEWRIKGTGKALTWENILLADTEDTREITAYAYYSVTSNTITVNYWCENAKVYRHTTEVGEYTIPTVTWNGKTFTNWNTKADGTGDNYLAGTKHEVSKTIDLYAISTITIDPNGGTINGSAENIKFAVPYGEAIKNYFETAIGDSPVLAKPGYDFSGKWSPDYEISICDGDQTFKPVWTPKEYTVVFPDYKDSEEKELTYVAYYGEDIDTPEELPPIGQEFVEWRIKGTTKALTWENILEVADETKVIEATAYYVDSGSAATVTYMVGTNSALADKAEKGSYTVKSVTYGGKTFTKWNTEADGSGTTYVVGGTSNSFTLSDDINLYAISTVTFDFDDGKIGSDGSLDVDVPYGASIKTYFEAKAGTGAQPTKDGYTFDAWSPSIASRTCSGDETITATYTAAEYSIKYEGTTDPMTSTYGEGFNSPTPPDKSGQGLTFVEWRIKDTEDPLTWANVLKYADKDNKLEVVGYYSTTVVKVYYYEGSDQITFEEAAAGTYTVKSQTVDDNTYTIWNTAQDGSGTTYIKDGTFTVSADTTLYAMVTVKFDANGGKFADDNTSKNVYVAYGESVKTAYESQVGTGVIPSVTGGKFTGWNPDIATKLADADATISAVWSYDYEFNYVDIDDGGKPLVFDAEYNPDDDVDTPPASEGTGDFEAYYLDRDYTKPLTWANVLEADTDGDHVVDVYSRYVYYVTYFVSVNGGEYGKISGIKDMVTVGKEYDVRTTVNSMDISDWKIGSASGSAAGAKFTPTADTALYGTFTGEINNVVKLMPADGNTSTMIERNGIVETAGTTNVKKARGVTTIKAAFDDKYQLDNEYAVSNEKAYDEWYLYGINAKTEEGDETILTVSSLSQIVKITGNGYWKLYNAKGKDITSLPKTKLGTGSQIKVYNSKDELVESFRIIYYGDINSSADFGDNDVVEANAEIDMGKWSDPDKASYKPYMVRAANLNQNSSFGDDDIVLFNAAIDGSKTINQRTGRAS